MRNRIVLVAAAMVTALIPAAVAAWEPSFSASPYWGTQSISYPDSLVYVAETMKWSSSQLVQWGIDGPAWLDNTAQCPNGNDQLDIYDMLTNIPNVGWNAKNDCGSGSYLEESELGVAHPSNITAEATYYFDTKFSRVAASPASGDVDISMQQWFIAISTMYWDWLEVDTYSC